jgi:PAS domain S-box-containing protein
MTGAALRMAKGGIRISLRDISEVKKLEARYGELLELIPAIVWRAEAPTFQITYASKHVEKVLGYPLERWLKEPGFWKNHIHAEDRERVIAFTTKATQEKRNHDFEYRMIAASGETVWLRNIVNVIVENNQPRELVGVSVDITEHKRTERALKESEDRYRDLVEHSQDLMCTHDIEGRLLSVNQAAARALGYETGELLQMSILDLLATRARPLFDAYVAQIRRDGVAGGLMCMLTHAGEERIWEYQDTLRAEGVPEPIVRGMAHDVTDQRRMEKALRLSEEKFSKAFRSSPANIVITSIEEGRFFDVNEAFERSMGFTRDELIGRSALELGLWAKPDERATVVDQIKKHGGMRNLEIQLRTKSGETRVVLYSAEAIKIGGEQCLLAVGQDITDRKRAEEELQRLSGRLLRLQDEERRKIARDLHDSTGQDLVVLAMTLSQLHDTIPSSSRKGRKLISQCQMAAERCIREIRTLSYILHPPMLDESGLEDALRHYVDGFAQRTGIEVDLDVSAYFGRLSRNMELGLFRVVQESLLNIQRHSGSFSAKIRLNRNPEEIMLQVSDTGRGISASKQKHNALTIGVGIPSMEERVRQVGGRLEIESSGSGTIVRVTIPAHG